jgi:hypothetical protein
MKTAGDIHPAQISTGAPTVRHSKPVIAAFAVLCLLGTAGCQGGNASASAVIWGTMRGVLVEPAAPLLDHLVAVPGVVEFRPATGPVSTVRDSPDGAIRARLKPGTYTIRARPTAVGWRQCTATPSLVTLGKASSTRIQVRCHSDSHAG